MNLDYGNVLTRAFQITWKHKSFWLFMMFPMLVTSAMFIAFAAPVFLVSGSYEAIGIVSLLWIGILILGSIINLVVSTAGISSLTVGILRAERGEGSTAFIDLVRDGFQHFGRVFSAVLIIQLTIGAIFTVFFLCMTLLSIVTMGLASLCLQPVMLLLTPLSFLVIAVTNGAVVAVIDENLSAWEAVKRAIQVVREHVWKFVILTLIVYLGTTITSSIFVIPAMIPAMAGPILIESGADLDGNAVLFLFASFACIFLPLLTLFSGIAGAYIQTLLSLSYLRLSHSTESETTPATSSLNSA